MTLDWRYVTIDWRLFFPPGTRVLALPSWQDPRLLVPAGRFADRWRGSSFYPAFRPRARFYRAFLRCKAATGLVEAQSVGTGDWPLGEFLRDTLHPASAAAIYVGSNGPAQKMTVRLENDKGNVVGYLKYGERAAARRRLSNEYQVLSGLRNGSAPEPIKHGTMGTGDALLLTSLSGKTLPARLTPASGVEGFTRTLVAGSPMPPEEHPWMQRMQERSGTGLHRWLETLAARDWSIVIQHGDLTSWNMLRKPDGTLGAVDWEYGSLEGFPYLDLAYHVLQTSALLYQWKPSRAVQYAVRYLTLEPWPALSRREADVLTRLAAYDAYLKGIEDGKVPYGLQSWRRAIWEEKP